MRTLERLQSSNAVLTVLVLALLAQMPHAQHVFFDLGTDKGWFGWVQSWFGAVALEFAVLVFVVRGKRLESWGFAVFSVAINLVYYYDSRLAWYLPKATWLLSAGLPVAIALYSHEVAGKHTVNSADEVVNKPKPIATPVVYTPEVELQRVDIAQRAAQLMSEYDNERQPVAVALCNEGYKQVDIASVLGVHKTQVSRWLKKEKVQ